jgi:mevalonate pyrophosphate decarboxylase
VRITSMADLPGAIGLTSVQAAAAATAANTAIGPV